MEKKFRIAIAGFQHESNSFSPHPTGYDAFVKSDGWPGLTSGPAVLVDLDSLNISISGFIQASSKTCDLVPITWSAAEPYGPVTRDAFQRVTGLICTGLRDAGEIDGVYLDLHGAMVCEHLEDGEGEILRRVREVVGAEVPLAMSLDLHANLTPEMVALSDAIAIYRTYPHLDMADTGAKAYALLESMLTSGEKPHKTWRQIPFLIPLSSQHTGSEPCRTFYDSLPGLTSEGVTSIDFACGFPPADIWHCGPAIVAYGASPEAVEHAADNLYEMIVASEKSMKDPLLSANDAVERAMAAGRPGAPAVIADVQDNPGAGGSSDTTSLLRALVAKGARGAAMSCFWDPEAAAAAHAAGEGNRISLGLGGKFGPEGEEPFQADFFVEGLSDGKAVCEGDMMQGFEIDIGPTALLRVADTGCDVRIVVSTERIQCLDQAFFRVAGVEPVEQSILAIKSTVHYRADFDAIASEIFMAACPGFHPCRLENLSYNNLRPGVRLGPNGPAHE